MPGSSPSAPGRTDLVIVGGVGSESRRLRPGVRFVSGVPTTLLRRPERAGVGWDGTSSCTERSTSSTTSRAASFAGVCRYFCFGTE